MVFQFSPDPGFSKEKTKGGETPVTRKYLFERTPRQWSVRERRGPTNVRGTDGPHGKRDPKGQETGKVLRVENEGVDCSRERRKRPTQNECKGSPTETYSDTVS